MNEFFTTVYDAERNSKFASPIKLAYEESKENKSIWRVTESFVWPDAYLEIEFTATASTMYWVWSVSNLADNTFYHHLYKNVTLTVVDE